MWILALGLAIVGLLSVESGWRLGGHVPSVIDDRDLWCEQRERASNHQNVIVIIGASRGQTGIVPSVLQETFQSHDVVQLAIDGHQPAAMLEDLADDQSFDGIVLCDLTELSLLGKHWSEQAAYVRYYHREWSLYKQLDRNLRTAVQSRLTIAHPSLGLREIARGILRLEWPRPHYMVTYSDRWRSLDYSRTDARGQEEFRIQALRSEIAGLTPNSSAEWEAALGRVAQCVSTIEQRGGRVVFIKLPTSGQLRLIEQAAFPDDIYWARLSEVTGSPVIDSNKVASLSGYSCPDGSHLDTRDAGAFTKALGEELMRCGAVLPY